MVTRPLRQAVGAHYGWKDWLVQRVTAVLMAAYTVIVLGIVLWNGGIDHALWRSLFAHGAFKLATFVFMLPQIYLSGFVFPIQLTGECGAKNPGCP